MRSNKGKFTCLTPGCSAPMSESPVWCAHHRLLALVCHDLKTWWRL